MTSDQISKIVSDSVQSGNWKAVAAAVLVGLVAFLRWVTPKINGKTGAWLNSDRGGTVLVFLGGLAGAFSTALLAHQPVTLQLVISGVITGALAIGAYTGVKQIVKPTDKKIVVVETETPPIPPEPPKVP